MYTITESENEVLVHWEHSCSFSWYSDISSVDQFKHRL